MGREALKRSFDNTQRGSCKIALTGKVDDFEALCEWQALLATVHLTKRALVGLLKENGRKGLQKGGFNR
jgi:hypothetical protein